MNTNLGYSKQTLTDENVLLSAGGSKALTNFVGSLLWDSNNNKIQYKSPNSTNWTDLVALSDYFSLLGHNHDTIYLKLYKESKINLIKGSSTASIVGWAGSGWSGSHVTLDAELGIYKFEGRNGWHVIYYALPDYAGYKVSFSFDALFDSTENTSTTLNGLYVLNTSSYANAIKSFKNEVTSSPNTWVHVYGTMVLATTNPAFGIMVRETDNLGNSSFIRIKNLKVELGENPSSWSPNPYDIGFYDLSNSNNNISINIGGITKVILVGYATNAGTMSYTGLTGSTTTANLVILSNGTANGWTLKSLAPSISAGTGNTVKITVGEVNSSDYTIPFATKAETDINGYNIVTYKEYSGAFAPNDGTEQWYTILNYTTNYRSKNAILEITTRRASAVILITYYNSNNIYITSLSYYGSPSTSSGGFTGKIRAIANDTGAIIQGAFYAPTSTTASYRYLGLKVYAENPTSWSFPNTIIADTATYDSFSANVVFKVGGFTAGHISTYANNTYNIGSTTYKYKSVYATTFYGALDGNASTASKWQTARTLTLTGSITGTVSIDGSGDVSLATTTNHNHDGRYVQDYGSSISVALYDIPTKYIFSGSNVTDGPTTGWISGLVLGSNWNNNHYLHYLVESGSRWYATRSYADNKMKDWNTFAYLTDINWSLLADKPTNFVYTNVNQEISSTKSFNEGKWKLTGNDSNDITNEYFVDGKLYNNNNTSVVSTNYSIKNAIKFTYNSTHWLIGNVRGGNTDTAGFGVALRDNTTNNVHLIDCLRVEQSKTTVSGCVEIGNGSTFSYIKMGYPGSSTYYALRYGGASASTSDLILGNDSYDTVIHGRDLHFFVNDERTLTIKHSGSSTGKVGIGTTSPSYALDVVGDIYASGSVSWASDIRLKLVEKLWNTKLENIANAPVFLFKWKLGEDKNLHIGTSAQYWKDKTPELVMSNNEGYLSLQYGTLGAINSIVIARELLQLKKEFENLLNSYDLEVKNLQGQINILQLLINLLRN